MGQRFRGNKRDGSEGNIGNSLVREMSMNSLHQILLCGAMNSLPRLQGNLSLVLHYFMGTYLSSQMKRMIPKLFIEALLQMQGIFSDTDVW